jgi:hypothetical protein
MAERLMTLRNGKIYPADGNPNYPRTGDEFQIDGEDDWWTVTEDQISYRFYQSEDVPLFVDESERGRCSDCGTMGPHHCQGVLGGFGDD